MGWNIDSSIAKYQHINLSDEAFLTINTDRQELLIDNKEIPYCTILNLIITNFYNDALSSIEMQCNKFENEMRHRLKDNLFSKIDSKNKDILVKGLREKKKSELLKIFRSRFKKHGSNVTKLRINLSTINVLNNMEDGEIDYDVPIFTDDDKKLVFSLGTYLKALFEEYATLAKAEREKIIYKNTYDKLNNSLNKSYGLTIRTNEFFNPTLNKYMRNEYVVRPYKIVSDEYLIKNYFICLSKKVTGRDKNSQPILSEKQIGTFRLSKIHDIFERRSESSFISSEEKQTIEKYLVERGPAFIANEQIKIKVKFTDKGLALFRNILINRPKFYKIDPKDKHLITFFCSEYQANIYFKKLGDEVEIMSPKNIKTS